MSALRKPALFSILIIVLLKITSIHGYSKRRLFVSVMFAWNIGNDGYSSAGVLPGIEIAVDEINNSTDILSDYKLTLLTRDTRCEAGYGTKQLIHLVQDPRRPIMLLGGGCSRATEPIADAAKFWNLVQVGFGASSSALSDKTTYTLFFRTNQPEHSFNPAKTLIMKYFNWSRVATIHNEDGVFSLAMNDLFTLLGEANITRLTTESFREKVTDQIQNIKRSDARIIVGLFYEGQARRVFCEAYRQGVYGSKYVWIIPGWYNRHWWAVNDTGISCTPAQIKMAAGNYIGMSEPSEPDDYDKLLVSGKIARDVHARYIKRINQSKYSYNSYYTFGYDAAWAVALTLNKSISTLQAQGKSLEEFSYSDNVTAELFKQILFDLKYDGMTGRVAFDENGDRIATMHFIQLQGDEQILVGRYDAHSNKLVFNNTRPFYWPNGSPPKDRTTIENKRNGVNFMFFVAVAVMSCLGTILALVCLSFNVHYRDQRMIKMSSPRLNVLTIIGGIMLYTAVTLSGIDSGLISRSQGHILCQIEVWLGSFGFTLAYGAVFAKTWRVYILFTKALERKVIKDTQLVGIVGTLLFLDTILLSLWQALDHVQVVSFYYAEIGDNGTKTTRSYVEICSCQHIDIWSGVLFAYKGLVLLAGAFLAWETRHVRFAALNESRNIAASVYTVLISSVVGIPVVRLARQYPNFTFGLVAALVITCTTLTLALMFMSKIMALRRAVDCSKSGRSPTELPTSLAIYQEHQAPPGKRPDVARKRTSPTESKANQTVAQVYAEVAL